MLWIRLEVCSISRFLYYSSDCYPFIPADGWFLFITLVYIADIIVRWSGLGFRSFKANGWNLFDVVVAVGALVTTIITRAGLTTFLIEQLQKLFLVSIAFKLVQRTNNLNQLFKTAM